MSEFFQEVDEEVRREQLKKLWDRYSALIVGLAVLIVAAVGAWRGYQYWQNQLAVEAGASFEAALKLSEDNKHSEAEAAFTKLATSAPSGYRVLARLRAAAETEARDKPAAVKLYDAIGADSSFSTIEQDVAKLRSAALQVDSASYADIRPRLEPLSGANSTFRHSARELLAVSAWRNNDTSAARQWVDMITTDPQTPSTVRQRAEALRALLPASAKS